MKSSSSENGECEIFANLRFQLYLTLTWGKVAGAKHTNITRDQAAEKTQLALRLWSPRRQVTASCQSFFSILASEFSPFNRKIKWCIRKFPQCQFLKTKLRTKFFDQNNKWPIESRRGSCGPWRIHAEEELRDIYRKLNSNSKLEFYQCSPLLLPFTKSHFIKCLLLDKYQI